MRMNHECGFICVGVASAPSRHSSPAPDCQMPGPISFCSKGVTKVNFVCTQTSQSINNIAVGSPAACKQA